MDSVTESTWGCALRERARCTYTCGAARPLRMSVLRLHSRSCALSANECAGLPSRAQPQEHREQLPAQSSLLSALTPGPTTLQTHHKPSVLPRAYTKYICLCKPPAAFMRSVSGRHWRVQGLGVRLRRASVSTSSSVQGLG